MKQQKKLRKTGNLRLANSFIPLQVLISFDYNGHILIQNIYTLWCRKIVLRSVANSWPKLTYSLQGYKCLR